MITEVTLDDFKGHKHTRLSLGRFTMLVGDNASGKTSVLEALDILGRVSDDPVWLLHHGYTAADIVRRNTTQAKIAAAGRTGASSWSAALDLRLLPKELEDTPWELALLGKTDPTQFSANANGNKRGGSSVGNWPALDSVVGKAGLYRLHAGQIAAIGPEGGIFVREDGADTARVLANMKLDRDEDFQQVEIALKKLIPSVRRIRVPFVPYGNDKRTANQIVFDFQGGVTGVPAHHASHGTLIVLSLLTILYSQRRPNLILLDDFDHALHPRAQMELVQLIKSLLALKAFDQLQIVATTHSPYVLDELDVNEVHVFAMRTDGTVATKPLAEHPKAEKTKGALGAGQLWSLGPERDWVLST